MNKPKFLFLLALLSSVSCYAQDSATIHSGFITGNTFRALNQVSKNIYATALIDGMLLAPLFGAPKKNLDNFEACTTGMIGEQIVAIFEKYLKDNPEHWHQSMHFIGFTAIKQACND